MSNLSFNDVSEQNRARSARWHAKNSEAWSGADWSNAMCGEAGEAANVVKKLRRIETGSEYGVGDRKELLQDLANEIADTFLYLDLLAAHYGIDIPVALAHKFNRVSIVNGFPERLYVT